jgi:chitodextrinase
MSLTAANCSWFHFQDTNVTDLQNVFLMVEWKTRDVLAGKEAKLYLHDGVSEINLGSFDLTLEYRWTEINITSVMETVTKVNSAKLKIASLYASFYHIAVRRAYLRIFNGPVPVKTGTVEWGRPGGQITLAVKWTDPDGLSSYALSHNASGSWLPQNLTEMLTGTEAWSNHTITLQLDTISVLAYRFWANDTNGNWEKTDVLYVYPVRSFNPDALRYIADVQDSSISHGYGRKDFYDIQTGRFWKFYSDGVNMKFTSTTDGQTWTPSQAVRTAAYGFTFYVHVSEGIVHYVYCSESPSADVFYRKGYLNMDGTIAWAASEQVAVDAGTSAKFYACSVVSDDNGCPYIIFGNRTNSNLKTLKLVKSDLNNGAWHTATGYPMQINESPDTDLLSGVALDLPNNEIYVVYCSAGNEEPPIGRLLQSDVLGPQENASDYTMPINYPFSAVSDKSGNVHVAYRRANGRIDYSFRNYSTGSWEIKDELVTSYVTNEVLGSTVYSWPVIGCADSRVNPHLEEVYVHWWTLEDKSAWLEIRNTTGWEPRKRILRLDKDYTLIDGDVVVERARQREILLDFVVQNVTDERVELWAYIQANRLPVATFTESAETANTGEAITFNASESYDLDGTIVRYLWSFGDDKNATGVVVEHSYADDGYYTVVLSIMDDDGDLGFASAMKTILNRPPHASFTASDYTAYPTKPITFNATESYDLDGVIVTYFWEFGDGRNDSGIIVEHDYQSEGNFTVTLTVTDDDGATDNTSATIMVLRRDVAVTALALSKIIIGVGFKVTMNVTVENQGEYDETFNVTVHANMGTIQTKNVFLAIGNSTAITFTWNTTSWTKDSYVIKAVANAVPGETDLDDNILVDGFVLVTFPGDVDGDRDVDVFDLVRIANAYGVKSPDALYDAYCDVDSDGDIDIFDLVLAAGNYGEYW